MKFHEFPLEFQNKATILGGEPCWDANDTIELISWLETAVVAVLGVELWQKEGDSPKWIASSNYECSQDVGWRKFVECCAAGARNFVREFAKENRSLFNLTWTDINQQ